jgi:hypothetical protein
LSYSKCQIAKQIGNKIAQCNLEGKRVVAAGADGLSWSDLQPFQTPKSGRIAVKVIIDYSAKRVCDLIPNGGCGVGWPY